MDSYSVKTETGAKEAASSANDATAATLQQMFAQSGALMSPLHFLPTSDGSSGGASALPWAMMPQYQMMVVPQSLLSAQGVATSVSDGHVIITPTMTTSSGERAMGTTVGSQSVASILQRQEKNTSSPQPDLLRQYFPDGSIGTIHGQTARVEVDASKPPKKPLTPYMTFSKMIWPQVKAANPHLSSVTEIGAVVGAMWRELDPSDKQRYNDQFNREKVAYSEELHSFLKSTGLHASDLVKPKAKKKDPRAAAVNVQHNLHQSHAATQHTSSATTSTATAPGAAALTSAGQQLIQTLLGLQPGSLGGQDGLASSNALSQAWTSQSVQQVLAQMGLSGQTLFANSDGTISVDGSLLTLQGQQVQLTGQVASTAYNDQSQMSTSTANAATDASAIDQSRGWTWHQPTASGGDLAAASAASGGGSVVVYQLPPAAVGGSGDSGTAATSSDGQQGPTVYYSVDAYGQLVRHETPGSGPSGDGDAVTRSENHLQIEMMHLQAAVAEKTREVDELRSQLTDAYATVERLKNERNGVNGTEGGASNQPTVTLSDGSATTVTVISPSTPS